MWRVWGVATAARAVLGEGTRMMIPWYSGVTVNASWVWTWERRGVVEESMAIPG